MKKGIRAGDTPIGIDVLEGKSYYWCSCGKSARQPFCDGSHDGSEFGPLTYKACLLYTSPSPRDRQKSRMPSSA